MSVYNPNANPLTMNRSSTDMSLPPLPEPEHDPPLGIH